jgi:acyl transferase domain-containing protein/aryl carrier-like protein
MAEQTKPHDSAELLKRALAAIDQLQAKLAEVDAAAHEPIAIIGMSCRFPGADTPDQLWRNLMDGVDSVTEIPPYRWDADAYYDPDPDAPGKAYTKWGGFIGDVASFDAPFFGITPREAVSLDPQQRVLMETVWTAIEDANISPASLAGTDASVYIGMSAFDYVHLLSRTVGNQADAYMASGTTHSIAGGRISYFLGAHGPNITLDTACSSSLVALHLGVKSLRQRDSSLSIAGGVNLTLIPDSSIVTSRARMMSPTGRCNTFDEAADGYVRAEGCGIILMKRLSDAQRDGNRILALIRGSAINQDGRSSGLTAPHGPSQEAVVRAALADGNLSPEDVDFIEAHGTGTSLGDPIEVNALANVFGQRPERPLVIGSIKANIGHTEPVAGVAGLIKAVQALRHRAMPKNLHLRTKNPLINWDGASIEAPTENIELTPRPGKTLICGVSSFGFSGTNSHMVLEEAPQETHVAEKPAQSSAPTVLTLSARTGAALSEMAGRYADLLESDGADLHEVAAATPIARAQFAERMGVIAADSNEACEALRTFARGENAANLVKGRTLSATQPEIVFLFTGQGSQYAGMGSALYESDAAFREAIDHCDAIAARYIGRSLKEIMFGLNGAGELVDDTTYTQPALFAIEYALAMAWKSWGVEPTAVMGHSVGEYAAACVAGVLSLEDALRLITARGALMGALPREGGMAAVFATEDVVRAALGPFGDKLSVAAVNGPTNIVISGAVDAIAEVQESLAQKSIEMQMLNVSHAFHSSLMDSILDEFEDVAAEVKLAKPRITLMSNITGARIGSEGARPDYWRRHVREAVRFSDSVAGLQREGYRLFLEIGPAPILTGMAQRCGGSEQSVYVPSLRKGRDDRRSMLEAAARLYVAGASLNWPAIVGSAQSHVALPFYPFQRTRFWPEGDAEKKGGLAGTPSGHSLLGNRVASAVEMYHTKLGVSAQSWVCDHKLLEFTPFPLTGFLELAMAAARRSSGPNAQLENIMVGQGLILPESGEIEAQIVVSQEDAGAKSVRIYSAAAVEEGAAPEWRLHASASITLAPPPSVTPFDDTDAKPEDVDKYYEAMRDVGGNYGPRFRGIRSMRRRGPVVVGEVALPDGVSPQDYLLHPALLDSCIQIMGVQMLDTGSGLFMPIGAAGYYIAQPHATAGSCRVTVFEPDPGAKTYTANFTLLDANGDLIAELHGLDVRQITRASLEKALRQSNVRTDWCFGVEWRESEPAIQTADLAGQNWLVFADRGGTGASFAKELEAKGANCVVIARPDKLDENVIAAAVSKAVPIDRPLHGVGLFWALDAAEEFAGFDELDRSIADQTTGALYALRVVADRAARILVTTRGTQQVDNRGGAVVQSAIWAFAGVVAMEHPTCGLTRVDLDPSVHDDAAAALVKEAALGDREDRVAYRKGLRYVARLAPQKLATAPDEAPVELAISERGSLGNLSLAPATRSGPGKGQIEVRVRATGLNFRDVLNALGMYPDEAPLGVEASGVVTAIGEGVTRFKVGDDAVAMTDHTFATFAVSNDGLCVQKPAFLTHQEAATVPSAFLTANYALAQLGKMKRRDKVFIHAATGGVGMAAVQLALRAGATVYGTAGSPAKRELAKQLGVHLVSDSRSLSFVEDIMRATDGKGVDIALNSLAGDFIPATLGLVRPGGTFIEIGKTDIWNNETVDKQFPGVKYHTLYLGEVALQDPDLMRTMLDDIFADMKPGGPLSPLPQTVYDLGEAEQAFRYMAQGLHTGKIVLTQQPFAQPRADGVYVITGGLTGLGLATADWLARNGAGGVALLGRRPPSAEAETAIKDIESAGARVRVAQIDVSDPEKLAILLQDLRATMGPIRGVFHAAGVLDDGMLSEQTPERVARVMAPKARGGWALHVLTQNDPVDFFVLFSSTAALMGSPGQSNYAAANGLLDGLAAYRQARGLPGLAINWGSWAEIGMAAGVGSDHHRRWAAMGLEMITPEAGMEMLADLTIRGVKPQLAAVPIVRSKFPTGGLPFYRELATGQERVEQAEVRVDILSEMRVAQPDARRGVLEAFVTDQVRRSLALPGSQKVDVHETLLNLGMDSLMAMELRNRLQAAVGVRVPVADLLGGATTVDLVETLMGEIPLDEAQTGQAEDQWEVGRL